MLWNAGVVLLVAWGLGVLGLYQLGKGVHVLFMAAGLCFLLAFAKARDAAVTRARGEDRSRNE